MPKVIVLTHYVHGPIRVAVHDDATWHMQRRIWSSTDDPELGSFEDGDFDESTEWMDFLLISEDPKERAERIGLIPVTDIILGESA